MTCVSDDDSKNMTCVFVSMRHVYLKISHVYLDRECRTQSGRERWQGLKATCINIHRIQHVYLRI